MPSGFRRLVAFILLVLLLEVYCVLHCAYAAKLPSSSSSFGKAPAASLSRPQRPKPFKRHIIAVGDLHGNYANARKILEFCQVVDDKGKWSGFIDFFVQTGDIFDSPDTKKLFKYMDKLRDQAPAKGGGVITLLGNHEWMNSMGDWTYVVPDDIKSFHSVEVRMRLTSVGSIGRSWAQNYTTASRLPLHPSIGPPNTPYPSAQYQDGPLSHSALSFVHGGLSPYYSTTFSPFPTKINDISNSLLRKVQTRNPLPSPYGYAHTARQTHRSYPQEATAEEKLVVSPDGPLWYRGWAQSWSRELCKDAEEVLKQTGTRRMIMGHTPSRRVISRCGGKVIIIDTGISSAKGRLSALSIFYTLKPIGEAEKPEDQEWEEHEVVKAVYPDTQTQTVLANDTRRLVGNFM